MIVDSLVKFNDHSQTHSAAGVDVGVESSAASIGCGSSHRRGLSRILYNATESVWLEERTSNAPSV